MNSWYNTYKFGIDATLSDTSTNTRDFTKKTPPVYQKEILKYLQDQLDRLIIIRDKLDGKSANKSADVSDKELFSSSQSKKDLSTFSIEQILRLEAAEVSDLAKVIISPKKLSRKHLKTMDRLVLFLNNSREITDYLDFFAAKNLLGPMIDRTPDLKAHYIAADTQWEEFAEELIATYQRDNQKYRARIVKLIGDVEAMKAALQTSAKTAPSSSSSGFDLTATSSKDALSGLLAVFALFAQQQPIRDQALVGTNPAETNPAETNPAETNPVGSPSVVPPATSPTGTGTPTLADDGINDGMKIGLGLALNLSDSEEQFSKSILIRIDNDEGSRGLSLQEHEDEPFAGFSAPKASFFSGLTTGQQKVTCVRYACYPGVPPLSEAEQKALRARTATQIKSPSGLSLAEDVNSSIIANKISLDDIFTQGSQPTCSTQSAYSVAYITAKILSANPRKFLPTDGDQISAKVGGAIVVTTEAMNTALQDLKAKGLNVSVAQSGTDIVSIKSLIDRGIPLQASFDINYSTWTAGGTNGGQEFGLASEAVAVDGFNLNNGGGLPVVNCQPSGGAGHAVAIVGYNKNNPIIKNSWGKSWGKNGLAQVDWSSCANAISTYGPPNYFMIQ